MVSNQVESGLKESSFACGVEDNEHRSFLANKLVQEFIETHELTDAESKQQEHFQYWRFEFALSPDANTSARIGELALDQRIDMTFALGSQNIEEFRKSRING